MQNTDRKLLALRFAYQILTDERNRERYCFSLLRNNKAGIVDYVQMLELLNDIAKDLIDGGADDV